MRTARQNKVLIIDEINYTRLGIDYALTSYGYKVTSTRNNEEAIQNITTERPDVILLSIRPNDTNGLTTLKSLKEYFRLRLDIAQGAEPPIIVLSASRNSKQVHELQYLGASVVLFKPINIQELPGSISSVISKEHKPTSQERKKILIFDGEIRSNQFIESFLAHEVYDFEKCESEAEATAKLRNRKFDLAILDVSSFESEITEALKQIREIVPEMLIIVVSAFDGQVSTEDFEKLNIQKHFSKPINVTELQINVDELMGERTFENIESKNSIEDSLKEENSSEVDSLIDGLANQVKQVEP
ncbi:MAG: Response regulator [Candidatus Poribacteria bacterium]|nr:Response regulator [Candidatus Poribacteria bacterium]